MRDGWRDLNFYGSSTRKAAIFSIGGPF